ncbi:hypothetical protein SADUNF_Sadunf18G0000900 [Salix dunnii]|uniref:Retrotransposon gag domain-containing protein n=1 Tax=Salix dunnii TaxID=1413687 RepID=A0A835J2K4_9ROSI|nr:hypothetical protein SADUNF_Sadunf18G0000900 [Salix dunnii]
MVSEQITLMVVSSLSLSLPLNTMFIPLSTSHDLLGFLDGSISVPSPKITSTNGSTQVNLAYTSWLNTNQTLLSLLYSSLMEKYMSEVLGLKHAYETWTVLESSFSHRSKTHELQIKDKLQLMQRGSKSVIEFSHLFKGLCDQLATIGRPIDDLDKALSHEIFEGYVNQQSNPTMFYAQLQYSNSGIRTTSKSSYRGKPRSPSTFALKSNFSSVYCQLLDKEGHLAKRC